MSPGFEPAPSQDIPIIRDPGTGREMVMARWGLVPGQHSSELTEPATLALLSLGLVGFGFTRRKMKA